VTWVKLDDQFCDHPKLSAAGPLGIAMQVAALCYCNRFLTDGFVPKFAARKLLDFDGLMSASWLIHDYLAYQPSREHVLKERAKVAARVKRYRDKRGNAVTDVVTDVVTNGKETLPPYPYPFPKEEAKEKTAASPASAEADPIFGAGLDFLVRKGAKASGARSFLGMLRKQVKDDLVIVELLATAEAEDVSEPMAWLRAAAKTRIGSSVRPSAALDLRGVQ
jgi:hypothetical protein